MIFIYFYHGEPSCYGPENHPKRSFVDKNVRCATTLIKIVVDLQGISIIINDYFYYYDDDYDGADADDDVDDDEMGAN